MAAIANGSIQSVRIKTKRTYQHSEARQNLEVQETEKWLIRTYMARVETIKLPFPLQAQQNRSKLMKAMAHQRLQVSHRVTFATVVE